MSITRQGSIERVCVFAYTQLSSFLQRHVQHSTIKSLSLDSGVPYNTLIGIKNMRLKSITLNRLMDTMDKVGMDYDIGMRMINGKKEVAMTIDRVQYSPAVQRVLRNEKWEDLGLNKPGLTRNNLTH